MTETNLLIAAQTTYAEPAPADNEVRSLSLNQDGRLRVSSKPGSFPDTTAALTTIGQQFAVDVADSSNIVLHVKNSGTATMAAGTFVFEGSIDSTDGINGVWFGLQAARSNANTIETTTGVLSLVAAAGSLYAWELSVNAVKWFRVRCTVATTASSIASWTAVRGSYATEPLPNVPSHAVTMTSTTVSPLVATALAYSVVTAATTNAAFVKALAGNLMEISISNVTAATIYVKLYNKATAPTVGTDVPLVTIPVLAGAVASFEYGFMGKRFNLGIALAVTAAAAATDVAVITAGAQIHLTYI